MPTGASSHRTRHSCGETGAAAARLIGNVRVQARIAEIMRAGAERAEVTVEQVLRELAVRGAQRARYHAIGVQSSRSGGRGRRCFRPRTSMTAEVLAELAASVAQGSGHAV